MRALALVLALLTGCATTSSAEQDAAAPWSWDGCIRKTEKMLILKCSERETTVSLARFSTEQAPTDEALYRVELDAISGTVEYFQPELDDSWVDDVEKVRIGEGDNFVWHQRYRLPEDPRRGRLSVHSLALPFEEEGEHYAVVYTCVARRSESCLRALKSLITEGVPTI